MSIWSNTTALILAGGLGTRLRSVVSDRSKVMAEIHGRPFLAYLLDQVASVGIEAAILCTGYKGEHVQAALGDRYRDVRLLYSQEQAPLGTAGALRLALSLLEAETALVMNGDSYCQANLDDFMNWHLSQAAVASLLLTQVDNTARYGQVQSDARGRIRAFVEKGGTSGPGWINAGIYLLKRDLLSTIPTGTAVSLEREMFPRWLNQGVYGYQNQSGRFLDIGTPESYAAADIFFANLEV